MLHIRFAQELGACTGQVFGGPLNLAKKIPGWPAEFIARVHAEGGEFYASGVDTAQDIADLGENYQGGIWTDRLERIGPLIKKWPTNQ